MPIHCRFKGTNIEGTGENRSWKGIPDPSGADQKQRCEALRTHPRDAGPYDAARFDGKKVRGELYQTVLEHTVRNISYRIPKGSQTRFSKLWSFLLARSPMSLLVRRSTESKASS
ncbi:jg16536 [Pararge aegeria aegeria]|uniref:Jg16536 protein n=1 Tax=Pararge aegeria aegeria TaxID=348720 RepID=A0A8S4SQT5_9NEOP|nr:jg16536 [Pararge aegeria aegeria]